jgi:uracil phosphoribosyltransferase
MQINHLGKDHSLIGSFMAELRDVVIQQDKFRFRTNIERLGKILAYEVSKTLTFEPIKVKTPLGEKIVFVPKDKIVIASILRAGLPLHQGILSYFDKAENFSLRHTENTQRATTLIFSLIMSRALLLNKKY